MADSTLSGCFKLNNLDYYNSVKFEVWKDSTFELLVPQMDGLNLDLVVRVEEVKEYILKSQNSFEMFVVTV